MARLSQHDLHGLIVVDKPPGITSHDVVDRIRKCTGVRRVGHAGTLDPFATGVLVVAVGKATRFLRYISDSRKQYQAHIVLGVETDTGDSEGKITRKSHSESWPQLPDIHRTLTRFSGTIQQTPPIYSAVRIQGKRAYARARAGEKVEVPSREVTVYSIEIIKYSPPDIFLNIECGSGTYIRSLARDIGSALNLAGYCHSLRRSRVGGFCLCQAWSLNELNEVDLDNEWPRVAMHPASAVAELFAVVLSSAQTDYWMNGNRINLGQPPTSTSNSVRVYSCHGQFIGIGRFEDEATLIPLHVFDAMN